MAYAFLYFVASGVMHLLLFGVAVRVAIGATRRSTRPRYLPPLLCGLVGYATMQPLWSLLYAFGGPSPVVRNFFDAPPSLITQFLQALGLSGLPLRMFLPSLLSVGFYIGLFAALYLLVHRRRA